MVLMELKEFSVSSLRYCTEIQADRILPESSSIQLNSSNILFPMFLG